MDFKKTENVTDWKIPLYKIYTDDEDVNLITKIIKRGSSWALGPEIEDLENSIKNYVNADYCLTLNSGTSALHATLLAYGINNNDEIIVPSFSFIATVNSVLFVNAKPKFADIEEDTFGLDPQSILDNINSKTKSIMPMDYGGQGCKIFDIKKIAEDENLILIEDGAESLGSSVNGKKIGGISDTTIFSFCGNKVLTTGEGGAITTNSKEIYEKIKLIRSHGRIDTSNYFSNPSASQYVGLGYNWRMSTLTAALGISQLQKLDKIIRMRKENAKYLSHNLSKIPQIKIPNPLDDYEHIYQMYTIRLENEEIRNDLHNFLTKKQIFSKVYFHPIHKTQFYSKFSMYDELPITEIISNQVLTIPLYPNMTNEEKRYLVESICEFFEIKND
jgi:perosamine synthetase